MLKIPRDIKNYFLLREIISKKNIKCKHVTTTHVPRPFALSGLSDGSGVSASVSAIWGRTLAFGVGRREETGQRLRVRREEAAHAGIRQSAVAVGLSTSETQAVNGHAPNTLAIPTKLDNLEACKNSRIKISKQLFLIRNFHVKLI